MSGKTQLFREKVHTLKGNVLEIATNPGESAPAERKRG
jgi:hypothetical protein